MSARKLILKGRAVTRGKVQGEVVVTSQPFMFAHGLDPKTGLIIDKRHELFGTKIKGKIFVFPFNIGSTTGGAWLLEAVRLKNAPSALVLEEKIDSVLATGVILSELFFHTVIPVVDELGPSVINLLHPAEIVEVNAENGIVLKI